MIQSKIARTKVAKSGFFCVEIFSFLHKHTGGCSFPRLYPFKRSFRIYNRIYLFEEKIPLQHRHHKSRFILVAIICYIAGNAVAVI